MCGVFVCFFLLFAFTILIGTCLSWCCSGLPFPNLEWVDAGQLPVQFTCDVCGLQTACLTCGPFSQVAACDRYLVISSILYEYSQQPYLLQMDTLNNTDIYQQGEGSAALHRAAADPPPAPVLACASQGALGPSSGNCHHESHFQKT